jgi:sortase (surface protein transpeptidase)
MPAPGPTYDTAAWFDRSPTPGEVGPSVIAGHLDSAHDGPSVFYRLGAVTPGDAVRISRADGSTVTFTVTEVVRFAQADFPTDDVYGDLDHPGLRLITCGGQLDPVTRHYLDNTVVFANFAEFSPAAPTG